MPRPSSPRRRLAVLAAAVGTTFVLAWLVLPHSPDAMRAEVAALGTVAPLVCLLAWVVLTPAMISGTLLAAATGLAFGAAVGVPLAVAGATLGGIAAFLIARRYGRAAVADLEGPRLQRLQERLEKRGFVAVLGARAAPGVPTTALNYAAGLSRIRLHHFAAGIALGGIPRIGAYTALGGSLDDLTSPVVLGAVAVLAAMALGGAVIAWRTRRRRAPATA